MSINSKEINQNNHTIINAVKKPTDIGQSYLRAARAGNLPKVLELLSKRVDINTANTNGLNALHLTAKEGHVDIARELLVRGVNPNVATKKGNTALHISSLAGQLEICKLLIENNAEVNVQSQNGFTPLYMAAQENHLEVVRILLANGANPTLTTDDGFTPLAVALQQGHDRTVTLLLESHAKGKVCLPALHIAAKKDDVKAANLLLNGDICVDHQSASGFTPLHIAAHYGNVNMCQLLLSRGANINFQAKNNITPLHVASKWGNTQVVDLLIRADAELECRTRDGLTPLHCASRSGHDSTVKLLLSANAYHSAKTRNGLTPLHVAAQGDHSDCIQLLLQGGANVDDVTVDYLTPLHVSAHCGNLKATKVLLQAGCDVNTRALNGFTPLHIACKKNRVKIAEILLKHVASIESSTESGLTPLHVAAFLGHVSILILLIQHGASPDSPTMRQETALHLATRAGQEECVRLLLRHGSEINAKSRGNVTPLHIAARLGYVDIVSLLLQHGANWKLASKDSYTPVHTAAKEDQIEVMKRLLEAGADITLQTKAGFTPLHVAVKYSHSNMAQLLIEARANINAESRSRLRPIHLAAHYGCVELVSLLIKHKCDLICQAKNGFTPLHIACLRGFPNVVELLIKNDVYVNGQSMMGSRPLHLAAQVGSSVITAMLLQAKAEPNAASKNGVTAMHLAAQEDRVDVAKLLVQHGAILDPQTKAGYTPLHTACHFGQIHMVKFLLSQGANVNLKNIRESNCLHLAAQQGHSQIVYVLLEARCDPNVRNKYSWTPAHIAKKQHYLNIFEALRQVTTCVVNWEEETALMLKQVEKIQAEAAASHNTSAEARNLVRQHLGAELERPDFVVENLVTDTEEEIVEPGEYTMLPGSPLFIRGMDSSGIEPHQMVHSALVSTVTTSNKIVQRYDNDIGEATLLDRNADHLLSQEQLDSFNEMHPMMSMPPKVRGPFSNMKWSGREDKLSVVSGEDSINESALSESGHAINIPWREHIDSKGKVSYNFANKDFVDIMQSVGGNYDDLMSGLDWNFVPENVPIIRNPITSGFLVSFLVDARGGSMRGSRHPGLRVLVPPSAASAPTRVTCRMLRLERTLRPPQLNDGEGLACRILELGPYPCTFNSPVLLELPHFASMRGRQRELVILRSDNGDTWKEHSLEASDQAVKSGLGETFAETLEPAEELREKRIVRVLMNDFPLYLAIVSRLRQETALIGSDGGVLSSSVVPQVQAVFPEGALQKRIRVGLQAHPIPTELVSRVCGVNSRVSISPIVTLEPRRRKFHKPITLTIPLPKGYLQSHQGSIQSKSGQAQPVNSLRLLCSITGGTAPAHWEDITGSTPLSRVKDCVSFTTTLSARFWFMDCQSIHEVTEMADSIYRESCLVPYMGKFVIFSKRCEADEALIRCFCLTDDKVDKVGSQQFVYYSYVKIYNKINMVIFNKTLECQEGFEVNAASPEVEVVEGNSSFLEVGAGIVPMVKSGEVLRLRFSAFRENRLAFPVKIKPSTTSSGQTNGDLNKDLSANGLIAFFSEQPKNLTTHESTEQKTMNGSRSAKPICALEIHFPSLAELEENRRTRMLAMYDEHYESNSSIGRNQLNQHPGSPLGSTTAHSLSSLHSCHFPGLTVSNQHLPEFDSHGRILTIPPPNWANVVSTEATIARSELDLVEVAIEIGSDWILLAQALLLPSPTRRTLMLNADTLPQWLSKRQKNAQPIDELHTDRDRALAILVIWSQEAKEKATGNELDRALRAIGREDIVKKCMRDIKHVSTAMELEIANRQILGLHDSPQKANGVDKFVHENKTLALGRRSILSNESKASPVPESSVQLLETSDLVSGFSEGHAPLQAELQIEDEKTDAQCVSPLPQDQPTHQTNIIKLDQDLSFEPHDDQLPIKIIEFESKAEYPLETMEDPEIKIAETVKQDLESLKAKEIVENIIKSEINIVSSIKDIRDAQHSYETLPDKEESEHEFYVNNDSENHNEVGHGTF